MKRCQWGDYEKYPNYVEYHDTEWGVPSYDDSYLFEMFVLESFHCGLSWLIVLNKRENFRKAFDDFDYHKIKDYDEFKIEELMHNDGIIKNKAKILATIKNAKAFIKVQEEFGSFSDYIWSFSDHKVVFGDGLTNQTTSPLSDKISKDLKKRGFSFMGTVTTKSYLQAIGIENDHMSYCFRYRK